MKAKEFIREEEVEKFYVIHPNWKLSEKVAITLTDISNRMEFSGYWEDTPNEAQEEFGWDLPIHDFGFIPGKKVKMTFEQYLDLVLKYARSGEQG